MKENFQTIKNPLTIIAIFAGISEISGTIVLPLISDQVNQRFFIFFLIFFPLLLISLFFYTLNKNHKVLYAPSDFNDQKDFVLLLTGKASAEEIEQKATEELPEELIGELNSTGSKNANNPNSSIQNTSNNKLPDKEESAIEFYRRAETLALNRLEKELPSKIEREVKISDENGNSFVFDGISRDKEVLTLIEVKANRNKFNPLIFSKSLEQICSRSAKLFGSGNNNFKIMLVVVFENLPPSLIDNIYAIIGSYRKKYPFLIEIRIYNINDLS
jgi:hypothetical protein